MSILTLVADALLALVLVALLRDRGGASRDASPWAWFVAALGGRAPDRDDPGGGGGVPSGARQTPGAAPGGASETPPGAPPDPGVPGPGCPAG